MDKAILVGIYDFINFHLCKELLNKGIEVLGVHIEGIDDCQIESEKRLEIGRNANFTEITLSDWCCNREENSTSMRTTLFISLYDVFMLSKEDKILQDKLTRKITNYIEDNQAEMVCILPIQLLNPGEEKKWIPIIQGGNRASKVSQFYLPTVYGPWQPSVFAFHQVLLSTTGQEGVRINQREWTGDCLYIEDAVETMLELILTEKNERHCLLVSGEPDYWERCAVHLHMDHKLINIRKDEYLATDLSITRVSVRKNTSIAEAFLKQMEQVHRLF